MCLLFETIKLRDGVISNIRYHQSRMNQAMVEMFPDAAKIDLSQAILIPENCKSGLFKVRVLYGPDIEKVDIELYIPRVIRSLKLVQREIIDYHLKYSDRSILQELFAQRGNCDDIIIIKNGFVCDSYAANLLFFDGEKWFTPETPLLKGTKRQFLLDQEIISAKEIRLEDIQSYLKVGLINAMIDFEEMPVVAMDQIVCSLCPSGESDGNG